MIMLILETALDPLSDTVIEPGAGLLIFAAVLISVAAVAFLLFLRHG
ncbi:hypothetical protein [Tessaracoccus caeni]|nr:hypothetical protein [Tessaracoccus caeni]MDF1490293.1 hypothetical protein [Tessaracoccus caeni]